MRNQTVGRSQIGAFSGPRFAAVMRINMSSSPAFAYSMYTSKYRFSLKIPVSHSSYSGADFPALAIFFHKLVVGKCGLRILVQKFHVGMRGSRIEMEIILLHVFAVIAFVPVKSKQAFLQYGIAPIPHRQRKTNSLLNVANSSDAVFTPSIRARPRMIVRKIFPRRSVRAVIFADSSPFPRAQIRTPALPVRFMLAPFFQSLVFDA